MKVKAETEVRQRKSMTLKSAEALAEVIRARNPELGKVTRRRIPRTPFGIKPSKSLELGWTKIPLVSRILITGVLLIVVSLTTPFWAYIDASDIGSASFGLWHLCLDDHCSSIHDNLVEGRDIPLWYMVSQMTFTIGVICVTLAMFVVTSNHQKNVVKLSPTTNSTMVMMLTVGVLQMSTGLYTFVAYFQDVSFLVSDESSMVDFNGSFYAGVAGTCAVLVGALMLFFDEEITTVRRYPYLYPPGSSPDHKNPLLYPPQQFVPEEDQIVPVITAQREILYGAGSPHYMNPDLLRNEGFRKKAT